MKLTLSLIILTILVLAITLSASLPPPKSDLNSASPTPSSLYARNLARRRVAGLEKLKLKFKRDMTVGQSAGMIFGIICGCLLLAALAVWFASK